VHWAFDTFGNFERYRGYGLSSSAEESVRRNKHLTVSIILADIADAQRDDDAYRIGEGAQTSSFQTLRLGMICADNCIRVSSTPADKTSKGRQNPRRHEPSRRPEGAFAKIIAILTG
jgi:hypothetical protein